MLTAAIPDKLIDKLKKIVLRPLTYMYGEGIRERLA